jgi:hypothetical protein
MINIPRDTKYYITSSLEYKSKNSKEDRNLVEFVNKFKKPNSDESDEPIEYGVIPKDKTSKSISPSKLGTFSMPSNAKKPTNKDVDNKGGVEGGFGGGIGGENDSGEVKDIITGKMGIGDIGAAAAMYATGGVLGALTPGLQKLAKYGGLKMAHKMGRGSIGREAMRAFGADMGAAVVGNIGNQLTKLSGFDFVNKNLGNIANQQMSDIMQGYGKKSFIIPNMRGEKNNRNYNSN